MKEKKPRRVLKNKPLLEAIFEVRWKLSNTESGNLIDPHYSLLLGRFYDKISEDYPEHETLPTSNMPAELVPHLPHHRFRVAPKSWPLIQIGPGLFAINSTSEYEWSDFCPKVLSGLEHLQSAHPKVDELEFTSISLRYINAIDFDLQKSNVLDFILQFFKIKIDLPSEFFQDLDVESSPSNFSWHCSFPCKHPQGQITHRFATSVRKGKPVLMWETLVESSERDLQQINKDFKPWLDSAHSLASGWFFKLIAGDLEKRFNHE